jgi:hypothetical protein
VWLDHSDLGALPTSVGAQGELIVTIQWPDTE